MPTSLALPGVIIFAVLLVVLGVQLVRALDNFRDTRHAASFGGRSGFGRKTSKFFQAVALGIGTAISACGFVICALSVL